MSDLVADARDDVYLNGEPFSDRAKVATIHAGKARATEVFPTRCGQCSIALLVASDPLAASLRSCWPRAIRSPSTLIFVPLLSN